MATVRNTRTGNVVSVPDHYVGHPILGKELVVFEYENETAPNNETKNKEQSAPLVEGTPEPVINTKEDKE